MIVRPVFIRFVIIICLPFLVLIHCFITRATPNPHYAAVFYKLGMECQGQCNINKQLYYFRKAVFYDPNLKDAYYQQGLIYGNQGEEQKEFEFYQKVAALDHTNAEVYFKIGLYYFQKENLDYALRNFLQSDRYKAGSPETFRYLAQIYERKQEYKNALHYYVALLAGDSVPYSVEACQRIWRISKIPDQQGMALDEVNRLRNNKGQEKLWEQADRYLRTDQVPEFMQKSKEEGAAIN